MNDFLGLVYVSAYDPIKCRHIRIVYRGDETPIGIGGYVCSMIEAGKKKTVYMSVVKDEEGNDVVLIKRSEDNKYKLLSDSDLSKLKFRFDNFDY